MRIAIAQINSVVGDIDGNVRRIRDFAARAAALGADLVCFPECAIAGYPAKDLLVLNDFLDANARAIETLRAETTRPALLVGFVDRSTQAFGKPAANACALIADGKILSRYHKWLVPTYDVFDEGRYFQPGADAQPVELDGVRIGVVICEDIWNDEEFWDGRRLYDRDPVETLVVRGVDLLIAISASPFTDGKREQKQRMLAATARRHAKTLITANLVGANDSLIFDGASEIYDAQGNILATAIDFEEDLLIFDFTKDSITERRRPTGDSSASSDKSASPDKSALPDVLKMSNSLPLVHPTTAPGIPRVRAAIALGIRDYIRKCGFQKVVLGLSGGIDSAVTAALAVEALGPENVIGVSMPSVYSSQHSKDDAQILAENLGIEYRAIPIGPMHESFLHALEPEWPGRAADLAEENIQARVRGVILMALSNKFGWLTLTTGNKSELAVGYCTLYGDMVGALAPLADVPKMMVYALAEDINANAISKGGAEVIPRNSIVKPPSAELRPDQKDSDSLPDYAILDRVMRAWIEERKTPAEIVAEGIDAKTVHWIIRQIERSEYKRIQAPIGLKITSQAFGYGWRFPVARGSY